jgi:hypothetical protein
MRVRVPRPGQQPALLSRAPRPAVFFGLSLLLHLVAFLGLAALVWEPWIPRIEITWLDLDNRLGAPRTRKAAPSPPPRVEPRPKPETRGPGKKLASRAAPRDAGVPADASVDAAAPDGGSPTVGPALADLAPGDAALVLALRMDRIRGSPYEHSVRRLLEVFYDHKTLLWSSGLDPVRDFEAMLIATPNPYRVTRTFLVARHNLPLRRIRRALNQATRFKNKRMRWRRSGPVLRGEIPSPPKLPHDPRVVLLRERLVMLTDPQHIPLLSTDLLSAAPRPGAGGSADAGAQRTGKGWLDSMDRLDSAGGGTKEGPGLLLMAINIPRLVRLPPDVPPPHSLEVEIPAVAPTDVKGVLTFINEQDAKRLLQVLPERIKKAKRSILLRLLGVAELLEAIRLKRDGATVRADLHLDAVQVKNTLEMFRSMIPQVTVPGMPPRRPPDAGAPDARAPDAGPKR